MNRVTIALLLSALISAACTSPKPPPAWPEGTARPINATIPGKAQR